MYILYTFHSTHAALYMEKTLLGAEIPVKIIPVPRAISSSCGLCARIIKEDGNRVSEIIAENEIETDGIYTMDSKGKIQEIE